MITADKGMMVLIHIGIDTVTFEGKHFSPKVANGQNATDAQLLAEFDIPAITATGFDPMVIMVVTNYGGQNAAVVPIAE